jgi:hypothetical protein
MGGDACSLCTARVHPPPMFTPTPALPRRGGGSQTAYGKSLGHMCAKQYWPSPIDGKGKCCVPR